MGGRIFSGKGLRSELSRRRPEDSAQLTHRLIHRCLRLRLALPRLNALLLHRERPRDAVQLVVESAGIAHGLALAVAAPQSCRRRVTIVTAQSAPSVARRLKSVAQSKDREE